MHLIGGEVLIDMIKVELKKIFSRKQTYMFWGILLIIIFLSYGINALDDKRISHYNSAFITQEEQNLSNFKSQLQDLVKEEASTDSIMQMKKIIERKNQYIEYGRILNDKTTDYKKKIEAKIKMLEIDIQSGNTKNSYETIEKSKFQKEVNRLDHILKNNIPEEPYEQNAFKFILNFFTTTGNIILGAIIIFLSGDIVSIENSESTYRLLLTQPVSRRKVIFGKYCAMLISILAMVLFALLVGFSIIGIIKGFGNMNYPYEYASKYVFSSINNKFEYVAGSEKYIGALVFMIKAFALESLFIIATASFGFLCSTLISTSSASISIGIVVNMILWFSAKYTSSLKKISHLLFVTYSDSYELLSGEIVKTASNPSINVSTAVIVLISTSLVFYLISHFYFIRKDILS